MRFSRKSNLELYWKDEQENKKFVNINTNDNTNGPFVTDSKTTYVNARSNVSKKKYILNLRPFILTVVKNVSI